MAHERVAFVHAAELELGDGTEPAAVGAAVTAALCGHWEHDGPCRWPHNSHIELDDSGAHFRTLFVAPTTDEPRVRELIERSLREETGWVVRRTWPRSVSPAETPLAGRLAATPSG